MSEEKETQDFSFALLLIMVGVVLLLNNFGILPWNVWQIIFRFWPLLLISWGIKTAFGENSILYFLSIVLIAFVFIYSASLVSTTFENWLEKQIPAWKDIKNVLPEKNLQIQKRKVFHCDPVTGECSVYYR